MLSKMENYIDVIIPRGGKNLIKRVQKLSNIPIIGHSRRSLSYLY